MCCRWWSSFLRRIPGSRSRCMLVDRVVDLIEEGLDIAVRIGSLPNSSLSRRGSGRSALWPAPARSIWRSGEPPATAQDLARPLLHHLQHAASRRSGGSLSARKQSRIAVNPWLTATPRKPPSTPPRLGSALHVCSPIRPRQSLDDGSLHLILEAYEPEAIPVSLVHRADRLPQAKVQSFIALAVPRLRKQLKGLDRTNGLDARIPSGQLPKGRPSC